MLDSARKRAATLEHVAFYGGPGPGKTTLAAIIAAEQNARFHELAADKAGVMSQELCGDRREGLMHDKFVVIDRQEVWTGSQGGDGSLRVTIIIALADKVHIIDCALATGIKLGGEIFPIQWQASVERAR